MFPVPMPTDSHTSPPPSPEGPERKRRRAKPLTALGGRCGRLEGEGGENKKFGAKRRPHPARSAIFDITKSARRAGRFGLVLEKRASYPQPA